MNSGQSDSVGRAAVQVHRERSRTLFKHVRTWLRSSTGRLDSSTWWKTMSRKSLMMYRSPDSDHLGSWSNLAGVTVGGSR